MRVNLLEQIYEMNVNGAEIWGMGGGGIVDEIQGKFCKKVLRIPRNATKREAENEFGREYSVRCDKILD
jgi:hypothetical protein